MPSHEKAELRALRQEYNMSYTDLANRYDISRAYVFNILFPHKHAQNMRERRKRNAKVLGLPYRPVPLRLRVKFTFEGVVVDVSKFTRMQGKILIAIAFGMGRPVSTHSIIDMLWGDDADGGPDDATRLVSVHMWNVRKRLSEFGLLIHHEVTRGYYLTRKEV